MQRRWPHLDLSPAPRCPLVQRRPGARPGLRLCLAARDAALEARPATTRVSLFNIQGAEEFFQWRTQALAEYARQAAAGQAGAGTVQAAEALWQASLGKFDEVVKLRAVDDRTLTMTLRTPVHFWLDLAAFAVLAARASRDARALQPPGPRHRPQAGLLAARTKAGNSVTNGPMRLAGLAIQAAAAPSAIRMHL